MSAEAAPPPNFYEVEIAPRSGLRRLGLKEVWEYRHLLWFFVLRTLRARYRPTMLGRGWVFLRPSLLSIVYILVFGILLRVQTDPTPFPLFVFTGIVVFQFFSGGVMETASSLVSNYAIMSKIYYPRLIVPLTSLLTNAVDIVAAIPVVALLMAIYGLVPPWPEFLAAPIFAVLIALATLALGVLLAAVAVRLRDIFVVLPVVMRVVIYSMPVAYPVALIPERFQLLYWFNPMSTLLQGLRWSLMGEPAPPLWAVLLATIAIAATLIAGLFLFARVERTMVDIL